MAYAYCDYCDEEISPPTLIDCVVSKMECDVCFQTARELDDDERRVYLEIHLHELSERLQNNDAE